MLKVAILPGTTGRKIIYTDEATLPVGKVNGFNLIPGDILIKLGAETALKVWSGTAWTNFQLSA